MSCLVVIPARWGSSRFPGKPLALIAGRPLLTRVVDLVRHAMRGLADADLVVATDDERVEALAAGLACPVARTDAALSSGSARALAAASGRDRVPAAVINVQGDAPFLPPDAITRVVAALNTGADAATPAFRMSWVELDAFRLHKRDAPFSGTTCTVGANGDALWFSKAIIPAIRDEARQREMTPMSPVLRHLGLYGYNLEVLRRFDAAHPSRYEQLEGLEQLRLLEMGVKLRVMEVAAPVIPLGGIDTPADVVLAERLIAERGDPYRG